MRKRNRCYMITLIQMSFCQLSNRSQIIKDILKFLKMPSICQRGLCKLLNIPPTTQREELLYLFKRENFGCDSNQLDLKVETDGTKSSSKDCQMLSFARIWLSQKSFQKKFWAKYKCEGCHVTYTRKLNLHISQLECNLWTEY